MMEPDHPGAPRIALCGAGRVGRAFAAACRDRGVGLDVIVDAGDPDRVLDLLNITFGHTSWAGRVEGRTAPSRTPFDVVQSRAIPEWHALGIDLVVDATGVRNRRSLAGLHLDSGARDVVVAGPCEDADRTIVMGVNDQELTDDDRIVSASSCTVNCVAPVLRALEVLGARDAMTTSVHCVTPDQLVLDGLHRDRRLGRGAMNQILPVQSQSPAEAGQIVAPGVLGGMAGHNIRVPVEQGALVEITLVADRDWTVDEVNDVLRGAAVGSVVLGSSDSPLASSDIVGCSLSCVVDLTLTLTAGALVRVSAWHDNEWGYAHRLLDVALAMGARRALVPSVIPHTETP